MGVEALRTRCDGDLGRAWREGPTLERLRAATAAGLDSPLRFILGGGDPDHSYMHGGEFVGHDPYQPLHERTALWLIAREAQAQPADGGLENLERRLGLELGVDVGRVAWLARIGSEQVVDESEGQRRHRPAEDTAPRRETAERAIRG